MLLHASHLGIIRHRWRVKWIIPGKAVVLSLTPQSITIEKGAFRSPWTLVANITHPGNGVDPPFNLGLVAFKKEDLVYSLKFYLSREGSSALSLASV